MRVAVLHDQRRQFVFRAVAVGLRSCYLRYAEALIWLGLECMHPSRTGVQKISGVICTSHGTSPSARVSAVLEWPGRYLPYTAVSEVGRTDGRDDR